MFEFIHSMNLLKQQRKLNKIRKTRLRNRLSKKIKIKSRINHELRIKRLLRIQRLLNIKRLALRKKNSTNFKKIIYELRDEIFKNLSTRELIQFSQTSTFVQKLVSSYLEHTNQSLDTAILYDANDRVSVEYVALESNYMLRHVNSITCYKTYSLKNLRRKFHLFKNINEISFNFHYFCCDEIFMKKVIFSNLTSLIFFECNINDAAINFLLNHQKQINSLQLIECEFDEITKFPSSSLFPNLEKFKCKLKEIPYIQKNHRFFENFILTSNTLKKIAVNYFLLEDINSHILCSSISNHKIKDLINDGFLDNSYLNLKPKMYEKFENINESIGWEF